MCPNENDLTDEVIYSTGEVVSIGKDNGNYYSTVVVKDFSEIIICPSIKVLEKKK